LEILHRPKGGWNTQEKMSKLQDALLRHQLARFWARRLAIATKQHPYEQRGRRPIFIATLRPAASWLFFRVARSSRIGSDMLVARALKNSQLTCGERHAISGTGH
jgi:hypothetical protein